MVIREDPRPNILFITTDQQRYDTIAAGGWGHMKTPNLDRLAQEGCLFQQAYSPIPACIPARHNLLTGLPARYHQQDDNYFDTNQCIPHELATFPQLLSDSGYDTIGIGKMHFVPARRHNGFHNLQLMDEVPRYREDDEYAMFLRDQGYGHLQALHGVRGPMYKMPQRSMVPEELHGSTWVANQTIAYLEENQGKRPFLIWAGFIQPHPPFNVPDSWADLYLDVDLPEATKTVTPLSALAIENRAIAHYPHEKSYLRRVRELYCAAISFVDHQVGRILEQLEKIGQLDNTLIIFTSDHGTMLGDLGTYRKFLPYDASARIPLIMRYPQRIQAGTVRHDFADLNDILPTMLDVAGLAYPQNGPVLPGDSLLKKDSTKDRSVQYLEYSKGSKRWVSLQNERYKYNYYYGGGHEELFDLEKDPAETTNLIHNVAGAVNSQIFQVKDEMRKRLIELEERWGLAGCVQNNDFVELEPYEPKTSWPMSFAIFTQNLTDPEERAGVYSFEKEVVEAVKDEAVVRLDELDFSAYQRRRGVSDEQIEKMVADWREVAGQKNSKHGEK